MLETRPRDLDLKTQVGNKLVSTVALTVEHFGGMWYETMIVACDDAGKVETWRDLWMDRYASRAMAEEGHERAVRRLRDGDLELDGDDDDD